MFGGIPEAVLDFGGWGVALVLGLGVVWLIMRGTLVPRPVAELWFKAWEVEKAARAEQDAQHAETLELARTTVQLLESIRAASHSGSEER